MVTQTPQTLPVLPPCRASSAKDLQEEAISDQLALLERLQPAAGQRAAVAQLAGPRSGAAVRAAARLHLLSGPGPAQGRDGEPDTGRREGSAAGGGSQEDVVLRGSQIIFVGEGNLFLLVLSRCRRELLKSRESMF